MAAEDLFRLETGTTPVLFSVPHAGTRVPPDIAGRLTPDAQALPDTDWYVDRLYDFAGALGAGMIVAQYSRYVIDLNRPPDDESLYPGQNTTGLCPPIRFDGTPIYRDGGAVPAEEAARRRAVYWQPYHDRLALELARLKEAHGFAILYDCHSIASRVPRLFEGTLPVLNLGTVHGKSCDAALEARVVEVMEGSGLTMAVNGRFVGGHITRAHGDPPAGIHALQMELGCDAYLADGPGYVWDEARAGRLIKILRQIGEVLTGWRPAA